MLRTLFHISDPEDRSLLHIAGVVVGLHIVLILFAVFFSPTRPPLSTPTPKRLVVQTVSLSPPKPSPPKVIAAPRPSEIAMETPPVKVREPEPVQETSKKDTPPPLKPKPAPKEEPKPAPKKEDKKTTPPTLKKPPEPEKKVEAPKAVAKAPPPKLEKTPATPPKDKTVAAATPKKVEKAEDTPKSAKKAEDPEKIAAEQRKKKEEELQAQALKARQQELLAQAQERIAKIAPSRDKVSPDKGNNVTIAAVPSAIMSLQIDDLPDHSGPKLSDQEMRYRDELVSRLKLHLRLPEVGDVKVKLTLERTGKVAKVVIVSAESAVNRKFLEEKLPSITFSPFGNFSSDAQYTFALTLSNE